MLTGSKSEISTFKGEEQALRADRIGMPGLLLSVVAASAPILVVAGVMPTVYAVMGMIGQPVLFLVLGVVLGLFSVGYAEMSRHVHTAGALYAYIARGLGGTVGVGASVVALVAYNAMQFCIYGLFGFEISGLLSEHFHVTVSWWIPAVATVVITWQSVPFVAFTLYAGLTQVPEELLEAAGLDGASAFQRFRLITYPLRDRPAGRNLEVQVLQDGASDSIGEGHTLEPQLPLAGRELDRAGAIGHFLGLVHDLEDSFSRCRRPRRLADPHAERAQRHHEHRHVEVEREELADR